MGSGNKAAGNVRNLTLAEIHPAQWVHTQYLYRPVVSDREMWLSDISVTRRCADILYFPQSPRVSDQVLVLLADMMAVLASTDDGRHHLLYGQDQPKWTHNKYVAPVN